MQPQPSQEPNQLLIVLLALTALFVVWHLLVEYPRQQAEYERKLQQYEATKKEQEAKKLRAQELGVTVEEIDKIKPPDRAEVIAGSKRIPIISDKIHGSINLRGALLDDITLADYRETVDSGSPEVVLLSPDGVENSYFAEMGWLAPGNLKIALPDSTSLWQADGESLSPGKPLTLSWDNGSGIVFLRHISIDDNYMFTITQEVRNNSGTKISLAPYGLLNRMRNEESQPFIILHEGPLGVLGNELHEIPYEDLEESRAQRFSNSEGWLGITDKYWLTAFIPENGSVFTANFSFYKTGKNKRFQVDYLGATNEIKSGQKLQITTRLFAGAKEVSLLDEYAEKFDITLFDRAVDFGVLYFLTKPIFKLLDFFYGLLGNFGLAILFMTLLIKALMFPLANKSYKAMNQMKKLQPEIQALKERCKDDKVKFQQEMMALYRKEKVNPASGCLPMLIQLPVFFALYKVLFVTIEMRHAPFYGWIKDLSAPDPTNIFELFGLLQWDAPPFMHIGVLPIVMSITMIVQQKLQPKPADPTQAKVMGWLPYIFLFLFAGFPAGLVLYWTWSNILSIIQQWVITRRHGEENSSAGGKVANKKRAKA